MQRLMVPDRLRFDYFDVTDDRAAWSRCEPTDDLSHDLILAGFKPFGCALAVHRANKAELVEQVWIGEAGRVIAGVGDGIELSTLFEDGTILKTSYRGGWDFLQAGWGHLRKHPADRHDHETMHADIATILARHLSRVTAVEAQGGAVVPATSMKVYFAMRLRTAELRIARQLVEPNWVGFVTLPLLALIGVVAVVARIGTHGRHGVAERPLLLVLGLSAILVAMFPVSWAATRYVAPYLLRFRKGPSPRPASDLLAMAESIPAGQVSRDE